MAVDVKNEAHCPAPATRVALRALVVASLLGLAACGGGGSDVGAYVVPAPPAGVGTEWVDVVPRAATSMPASRTDVPKFREDATALGNNACCADHTTNSTLRILSGFLDIVEPSERKMNSFKASD